MSKHYGIVVMMVDGADVTVLGVTGDDPEAGIEIAKANALMYSEGEMATDIEDRLEEFEANVDEAIEERKSPLYSYDDFDIQFESGFGSWDYRLVRAEVKP